MPQEPAEQWMQRVANAIRPLTEDSGTHRWLLRQTLYTHFQRLVTLRGLGDISGAILDIGAGTGALSLDLAWWAGPESRITAIDPDDGALDVLRILASTLAVEIETRTGKGENLTLPSASQNLTVARYVFQHLPRPEAVLAEMCRVTQPGGRIMIIDVDDGLSLGDPVASNPLQRLREAIRIQQSQRGGNRLIGRQLYGLLRAQGLEAIQIMLMPRFRLGLQHGRDAGLEAHQIDRLLSERKALISAGLIEEQAFEQGLAALKEGFTEDRFEIEADFIAIGRLPESEPSI